MIYLRKARFPVSCQTSQSRVLPKDLFAPVSVAIYLAVIMLLSCFQELLITEYN